MSFAEFERSGPTSHSRPPPRPFVLETTPLINTNRRPSNRPTWAEQRQAVIEERSAGSDGYGAALARQQFVVLDNEIDYLDVIIDERCNDIDRIAEDVQECSVMMKDIAKMVEEQGHYLNTIDDNIEVAATHIEDGVGQLRKANKHQKSARKKKMGLLVGVTAACAATLIFMKLK